MSTDTAVTAPAGVRPFGLQDKVGYMFGDFGNDFVFLLASAYLLVFYTNVAGLDAAHVGTIFLVVRLVDAFVDVGWGRFLDRAVPHATGRFRPWILRAAPLVALSSMMMYAPFVADWDYGVKLGYAVITYTLWSFLYTVVNISYGSLAAVITDDSTGRASLSVFRGIGANLAGLFISVVPPLFIYATVDGVSQVQTGPFFLTAVVVAVFALVFHVLCHGLVRERVAPAAHERAVPRRGVLSLLGSLLGNRALISLMVANLVIMLSSLMVQALAPYLWLTYFNDGTLSGPAMLAAYLPGLLLATVAARLVKRFGKREVVATGLLASAAIFIGMGIVGVTSAWVFIGLSLVAGIGSGAFTLLIWAMVSDVIDYEEVRADERDDGTVYAINVWARKVGLALAGGIGGYTLGVVGYDADLSVQAQDTVQDIYRVSTFVPGAFFVLAALILLFWYPLGRRTVESNVAQLERRRGAQAA